MTVYFVPDRENPYWTPIGAAGAHSDGEGFSLRLDLLPNTPGNIQLRKRKPKEEAVPAEEAGA
ncbi:hypothetical protein [Lichenifustis flavocetrariae]|uniref:Uncharacterized protein n=1 Tax=Lichenifustis flavocetrariae TaxID=2949735 RepID=A0AA41Z0M9_9HYPH|nr:hypothetical protein [Lichenifustis flavocetrariae]MCW6512029.1 hypothetical protein [Lichenifustis flavocetrariae]